MCVSGPKAAEGKQWRWQQESGGPPEMNKGVDLETQPCAACDEEEVVERRLSANGAHFSLKLTTVVLLLETNFKLSEISKEGRIFRRPLAPKRVHRDRD